MTTRDEIKEWLREQGKSREWLGERVGVSKGSVDNWLSEGVARPIPAAKMKLIEELMQESAAPAAKKPVAVDIGNIEIINVILTREEMEEVARAAAALGLSIDEFARNSILEATETALQQTQKTAVQTAVPPAS